jgi:4-amino-4-deoxy-L-arabinose transferase-like glycosyltransferase
MLASQLAMLNFQLSTMPLTWIFLLIAFLLLRLVFWLTAFPNPDEAYYWLWGQHPALSYFDHPPWQAWMQGLFTASLGRSLLTLRLPNLMSNAILAYTYYKICRYLYGDRANQSFWLVLLMVLASPLYFLFLGLAWPDHWLIMFTLMALYAFITFLDSYLADGRGVSWRLWVAAIALGLAGLCKYSVLLVAGGWAAGLIADGRLRALWRDPRLYCAIAITASALTPMLLWNVLHDWQSWRFYADRSVGDFSLKWAPCLNFLLFSGLLVSPWHWVGFYRAWRCQPMVRPDSTYTLVAGWVFLISTGALTVISLLSAALYYWNITAYLLLLPLLPRVLWGGDRPALKAKRLFWGSQCYGLLFAVLLVVQYCLIPPSALVNLAVDPDARIVFGWPEVAAAVQQQAAELPAPRFLLTTDYRSAAALAYQLNQPEVAVISDRPTQFDLWYPQNRQFATKNAVILADDWHPLTPALLAQFDQTTPPLTVSVRRWGFWIKNYYVCQGYGFK